MYSIDRRTSFAPGTENASAQSGVPNCKSGARRITAKLANVIDWIDEAM